MEKDIANDNKKAKDMDQLTSVFFQKFSNVVKPKITEMKDKLVEYVVNPNQKPIVKHVSSGDKLGRRYKGSKFSLDDSLTDFGKSSSFYWILDFKFSFVDDEDENNLECENEIDLEEWKRNINPIGYFECFKINSDASQTPG